jgi:hypothetical protein
VARLELVDRLQGGRALVEGLGLLLPPPREVVASREVLAVRLQHDHAHLGIAGGAHPGGVELVEQGRCLGVGRLRAVQRDGGDPFLDDVVQDHLVRHLVTPAR